MPVRGETARAAPNVFSTFQKHFLVNPQDSAVNKYLRTVASGWIFIHIEFRCTEPRA